MRYYKMLRDGMVVGIGTGESGAEITEQEYTNLLSITRARPVPPEGYDYVLTTGLEWQLVEVPPVDEGENEAEEADYINALNKMGVET